MSPPFALTALDAGFNPSQLRNEEGEWTLAGQPYTGITEDPAARVDPLTTMRPGDLAHYPKPKLMELNHRLQEMALGANSLDVDELYALSHYSGDAYEDVNPALREQKGAPSYHRPLVDYLDRIMGKTALPKEMVVYRKSGPNTSKRLESLPVGADFVDHGYMSTSLSPKRISHFEGDTMEIEVPKGYQAMPMGSEGIKAEAEVLLRRGTHFRVIQRREPGDTPYDDPKRRLRVRVIASEYTGDAASCDAGFNPDQPRNEEGEWTESGGAHGEPSPQPFNEAFEAVMNAPDDDGWGYNKELFGAHEEAEFQRIDQEREAAELHALLHPDPEELTNLAGEKNHEIERYLANMRDRMLRERPFDGDEAAWVDSYVGSSYDMLNPVLRKLKGATPPQDVPWTTAGGDFKAGVRALDKVMARSQLPEGMVLYRKSGKRTTDRLNSLPVGGHFVDPGYMSTSANPRGIAHFSGDMMEIEVPKGYQALPLGGSYGLPGENEVLLRRATHFKVLRKKGPGVRMRVRVVPSEYTHDAGFDPSQPRDYHGQWTLSSQGPAYEGTPSHSSEYGASERYYGNIEPRLRAHMTEMTNKWGGESIDVNKVPSHEWHALEDYVSGSTSDINAMLRDRTKWDDYYEPAVNNLTSLLERASLARDMTVYRAPGKRTSERLSALDVGDEFVDPGFTSTSAFRLPTKDFPGARVEIHVPQGYTALPIGEFGDQLHEAEVLLQRDTRFRVVRPAAHPHGLALEVVAERKRRTRDAGFDEDQPRDTYGRWSLTPGGGGVYEGTPPPWSSTGRPEPVGERVIQAHEAAAHKLQKEFLGRKVDNDEDRALQGYAGSGYGALNRMLRNTPFESVSEVTRDRLATLDNIMEESRTPKDMLLFRKWGYNTSERLRNLDVGDTFTDPGFVSTSLAQAPLTKGAGTEFQGSMFFIEAPKGTRAIPVGQVFMNEAEVLLDRGTTFKVVQVGPGEHRRLRIVRQKHTARDAGFNPDQPRDEEGMWTSSGAHPLPDPTGQPELLTGERFHKVGAGFEGEVSGMSQQLVGHFINRARERATGGLDLDEIEAVEDYTADASDDVNRMLRDPDKWLSDRTKQISEMQGEDPDFEFDEEFRSVGNLKAIVQTLDRLVDRAPLAEDMLLYRKFGLRTTARLLRLNEGDDFVDPGFMSTTAHPDSVAHAFGQTYPVIEIEAPKGSRAVPLGDESGMSRENEVLLGRGNTYRVIRRAGPGQRMRVRIVR